MIKRLITLITMLALTGCGNSDRHHYQGYVEGRNIYLASPFSGTLIKAYVQRGQHVKKGELLFQLDPDPQSIQVSQAFSGLKQAEQVYHDLKNPKRPPEIAAIEAQIGQVTSQVVLAALRVKRNQTLYDKRVLDKDSLDASIEHYEEVLYLKKQYEANLVLAKEGSREYQIKAQSAQVNQSQSKLKEAKWQLAQKRIYAPADGVIFDIYFKEGEFVGMQQPLAALLTPENIQIDFFVPVEALAGMHVRQNITFDCDGCAKNNQAVLNYISPEAEYVPPLVYSRDNRDKLIFRIKADIHDPTKFKPGQPVIVTVFKHE